jgi:hypothetical protein
MRIFFLEQQRLFLPQLPKAQLYRGRNIHGLVETPGERKITKKTKKSQEK